jgi:hypothetical protein
MVFCLSLSVTENGRRRRITKLRATLKQLINKAAAGDFCAARVLKIGWTWRRMKPTQTRSSPRLCGSAIPSRSRIGSSPSSAHLTRTRQSRRINKLLAALEFINAHSDADVFDRRHYDQRPDHTSESRPSIPALRRVAILFYPEPSTSSAPIPKKRRNGSA